MTGGLHCHQCPCCSTVWQHPDSMAGDDEAHQCPRCGTEQRRKLHDPERICFPWTGKVEDVDEGEMMNVIFLEFFSTS